MESFSFRAPDALREGLHNVRHQLRPKHPLEEMDLEAEQQQQRALRQQAAIRGTHVCMTFQMEKALFDRPLRPTAISSGGCHRVLWDVITGRDESIGFEDFLGGDAFDPETKPRDLHQEMEEKFGLAEHPQKL